MTSKIIGIAAALAVTHDFGSRQEPSSREGVEFKAGVPQRFDFVGQSTPYTGTKIQLPDNGMTVGKAARVTVDFYVEGEEHPLGPQDVIDIHEGKHGGYADTPTEPGKEYCAVITTSHDIGFAVLSAGIQPPPERRPNPRG